MIYMFLSNNPSSGDINSSNLPCLILFVKREIRLFKLLQLSKQTCMMQCLIYTVTLDAALNCHVSKIWVFRSGNLISKIIYRRTLKINSETLCFHSRGPQINFLSGNPGIMYIYYIEKLNFKV